MDWKIRAAVLCGIAFVALTFIPEIAAQQAKQHGRADASLEMPRISAEELAATLRGNGDKPLVLQVGVARLYRYSHIRGAEFAGPASESAGIEMLRKRVQGLKNSTAIVIYCGCCPWEHCPNVRPAYDELRRLGFSNVRALYLPSNYKFDWEDKGYPTAKGE